GTGGTLIIRGAVSTRQENDFASNSGVLSIVAASFAGTIGGLYGPPTKTPTNAGDLSGVTRLQSAAILGCATVEAFSGADQTGSVLASFQLASSEPDTVFVDWQSDGQGGTSVFLSDAPCFVEGTGIATTCGRVAVEDLRVGDQVLTGAGVARPVR